MRRRQTDKRSEAAEQTRSYMTGHTQHELQGVSHMSQWHPHDQLEKENCNS